MNDHDVARGHPSLTYERYVKVLLSTCSTSDSGDGKEHAVYQSKLAPDIDQYDDVEYAAYSLDTDVVEIMAYAADTTRFGNGNGSTNQSSNRIPYSEWIQLPEEQRNKILAKRKQERLDNARKSQPSYTNTRRANTHHVETYIDLDIIINNAVMYEDADPNNDSEVPTGPAKSSSDLLAYPFVVLFHGLLIASS
jgi:predicted S18 family serine protease